MCIGIIKETDNLWYVR